MPFGPMNAPVFYSEMMKNMKYEWDNLFLSELQRLPHIRGEEISITTTIEVYIGDIKIISGTRIIIDDILLWCSNVNALFYTLNASVNYLENTG